MRICVVGQSDPHLHRHGGTLRTLALVEACAALGHEVTCIYPGRDEPPRAAGDGPGRVRWVPVATDSIGGRSWPGPLRALKRRLLPMPTPFGVRSAAMAASLRAVPDPDVLVVSQLAAAGYHDDVPGTRLWVDHSDLWSSFAAREASTRGPLARVVAARQATSLARREDELTTTAAVTTAAGWSDVAVLSGRTGAPVTWLPTPLALDGSGRAHARGGPPTAGFLANFGFWPNVDAVQLLASRWAPRLREKGWRVVVAGLGSDGLSLPGDVEVLGPVASLSDYYAAVDLTLAPIRLGGGMKVKVVESLLYGVPVAATEFAVDGFPPAVRRLVTVVDPEVPEVPEPAAVSPVDAGDPELRRFRPDAFRATVAGLLGDP